MIQTNKNISTDISDFGDLIDKNKNHQFADKSLFIKEILDNSSQVTLIAGLHCWRKTLNLSMLEYFLAPQVLGASTSGIFDTLAIGQVANGEYLRHQGQYSIIFISFKDIQWSDFNSAINSIRILLQTTFRQHAIDLTKINFIHRYDQQLLDQYAGTETNPEQLQNGLRALSELLFRYHENKKVYIPIDEYDTPLNYAYNQGYFDDMARFMTNLLSAALKDNPYLHKGIMTGVSPIRENSLFSGLNNIKTYSVLHPRYMPYFEFSDEADDRVLSELRGYD